jgi:hypothetical protein
MGCSPSAATGFEVDSEIGVGAGGFVAQILMSAMFLGTAADRGTMRQFYDKIIAGESQRCVPRPAPDRRVRPQPFPHSSSPSALRSFAPPTHGDLATACIETIATTRLQSGTSLAHIPSCDRSRRRPGTRRIGGTSLPAVSGDTDAPYSKSALCYIEIRQYDKAEEVMGRSMGRDLAKSHFVRFYARCLQRDEASGA